MEYFTIDKRDGHNVSCVKEIPHQIKGIVIAIHGFSSNRDCATYKLLLRRLPEAGYGMIGIELPGHGSNESSHEILRIPGALDISFTLPRRCTIGLVYRGMTREKTKNPPKSHADGHKRAALPIGCSPYSRHFPSR